MLLKIYPENPSHSSIRRVVEELERGGIIIYPTDTVYGMGCDIMNPKAVEKVARLKGINPTKANFSFICHDLSHISDYTKQVDNPIFKLMKRHFPGPFTFILQASSQVPKMFKSNKKTVGIRIPNNPVILEIVRELGRPILSTSIHDPDEVIEYTTDPELIYEKYKEHVNIIIDGGYGNNEASTIVNCTKEEPVIERQGLGILDY